VIQGAVFFLRAVAAGEDHAHPLLHLVSGGLGLTLAGLPAVLVRYGLGFGVAYALLGVAGALGLVRLPWLPLGPADHTFHLLLGVAVAAAALVARRQPRAGQP